MNSDCGNKFVESRGPHVNTRCPVAAGLQHASRDVERRVQIKMLFFQMLTGAVKNVNKEYSAMECDGEHATQYTYHRCANISLRVPPLNLHSAHCRASRRVVRWALRCSRRAISSRTMSPTRASVCSNSVLAREWRSACTPSGCARQLAAARRIVCAPAAPDAR